MKLHKKISVNGIHYSLIDSNVRLQLFTPGRAAFTLESSETLSGIVIFSSGYAMDTVAPWFIGYVESSTTAGSRQQRIFCRELSAALYYPLSLALREVDLITTLNAISESMGVDFVLPQISTDYSEKIAPAFYTVANGYYAMDALSRVYNISRPVWQQQTDGKIFVGSWDHSRWASRPIDIPNRWEHKVLTSDGATLTAIPSVRPGALYNDNIITSVEFTKLSMNLTWSKNPWNTFR